MSRPAPLRWVFAAARIALRCAGTAVCLAPATAADAQVEPTRLYCGIRRPIPVRVEAPADAPASVLLLRPGGEVVERAPVRAGMVDLAALFPRLWEDPEPALLYAQLDVAGEATGPGLVLQPMLSPEYATLDSTGRPRFAPLARRTCSGLRVYTEKHVILETTEGEMEFRLRPDAAPNTAFNFLHLVEGGFYTDVPFHRVFPATRAGQPFVVQFGDPTGSGEGSAGYMIDLENSPLPHSFGVLSMARSDDPNWNGSQVIICLSREGTAPLDGAYTSFGELVSGAEVLVRIERTPLEPRTDRPLDPPIIRAARAVDAPPRGRCPDPPARPEIPVER